LLRCTSKTHCVSVAVAVTQKNRELEAAAAENKKKDAGEYDVVVRQLQFEMKAKVRPVLCEPCIAVIVNFCE